MLEVAFELNEEKLADLNRMVADGHFEDRRDLLNSALTVMQWAIRHAKAGHTIAAVDEDGGKYHELAMPFLTGLSEQ